MARRFALALVSVLCAAMVAHAADGAKKWVGTWSAAPYDVGSNNMPPSPGLAGNTMRQIVRVSIGGDTLRMRFTNGVGNSPLAMNTVTIAVSSTGTDAIDASTLKTLTFGGDKNASIPAKSSIISDPFAFPLKPGAKVAITIHYATMPSPLTGHVGARTPSYLLAGDKTTAANFSGAAKTEHWYTIDAIDVLAPQEASAVAILGNSITDGYGLTGGLQNRWTDAFSEKLLANATTSNVGVLNLGIGGTNVASGTTGGLNRYKRDILEQSGVAWFVVFYGVNDIGAGANSKTVIDAYKQMIAAAHAKNIKVYGATITPFKGNSYYTGPHEAVRDTVNTWIRTPGNFDAVLDFDKAIRNPNDPLSILATYNNDGLHPNANGYKAIGQSVDLKLFETVPTSVGGSRISPAQPAAKSLLRAHDGTISLEYDDRRIDGRRIPTP